MRELHFVLYYNSCLWPLKNTQYFKFEVIFCCQRDYTTLEEVSEWIYLTWKQLKSLKNKFCRLIIASHTFLFKDPVAHAHTDKLQTNHTAILPQAKPCFCFGQFESFLIWKIQMINNKIMMLPYDRFTTVCWVREEGFVTAVYNAEMFEPEEKRTCCLFLPPLRLTESQWQNKCRSPRFIFSFSCTQHVNIIKQVKESKF